MANVSAISKAYKRKNAASASNRQKKPRTVSRKDREYMADFGTLEIETIKDSEDDDENHLCADLANHLRSRQAFTEDQLDQQQSDQHDSAQNPSIRMSNHHVPEIAAGSSSDEDNFDVLMAHMTANKPKTGVLHAFKSRQLEFRKEGGNEVQVCSTFPEGSLDSDLDEASSETDGRSSLNEDSGTTEIDNGSEASVELDDADSDSCVDEGPSATECTNWYNDHFSESETQLRIVQDLVNGIKAKTHVWQTYPTHDEHVTYQTLTTNSSTQEMNVPTSLFPPVPSLSDMHIKPRLLAKYMSSYPKHSDQFVTLFNVLNQYNDVLWTGPNFYQSGTSNRLRRACCLHVLNHVYKSRTCVLRNNAKLVPHTETHARLRHKVDLNNQQVMRDLEMRKYGRMMAKQSQGTPLEERNIRDQGFTRPKVLIIVPMRNLAWDIIQLLIQLSGTEEHANKSRFKEEYYSDPKLTADMSFKSKPADYQTTFKGNVDDCFTIGLSFPSSKKSMKLYSQFYKSDVIVASPLGLRLCIEKEQDMDFLSSIELVVVDSAHVLYMQNWDHLQFVFDQLNQIPKVSHDTDYSRLKGWYLDNLAKNYRQTILLSEYVFPELTALFNQYAQNVRKPRFRFRYPTAKTGSITDVQVPAPQTFIHLEAPLTSIDEVRFKYLTSKILPQYRSNPNGTGHCDVTRQYLVLFIPNYLEYVPVRNYMDENDYDFEVVTEYSNTQDKTRARTLFYQGRTRILVYTERAHFYMRLAIKGALHLVFYNLPENARFYPELCNFLALQRSEGMQAACRANVKDSGGSVTVLYSKWDALKLQRVVGHERTLKLIAEGAGPFVFCS